MFVLLLLFSLGQFLSLLCLYIVPGWFSLPIVVEITPESIHISNEEFPLQLQVQNLTCSSDVSSCLWDASNLFQ